jgi:tRNA(Ile)-lysidine synthase TilS/MesJ
MHLICNASRSMPLFDERIHAANRFRFYAIRSNDHDLAAETLEMLAESYLADDRPWVVAYSGGKDSTLVLQLVYETLINEVVPGDRTVC